ncbi:uncharacterized protein LOC123676973 [Harmonia axyridis]|uniref:uncharacterized protein LOC123676973 n=1 Tax=Harmonia axyridis TaxID=115357 RepID=UPI001E277D2C|nr:uncharacterized protein LOC123676973 [Harmonia axyridis]
MLSLWRNSIFFHFVDVAVVKSYILYLLSGEEITHKDFRRRVIDGLVAEMIVSLKRKRDNSPLEIKKHKPQVSIEVRLDSSAHQPGRGTRRRCAVCSTKINQVRTEWTCTICKVPLCLSKTRTCFQDFHSKA